MKPPDETVFNDDLTDDEQVDISDTNTFRRSSLDCLKRNRERREQEAAKEKEELVQWQTREKTNGQRRPILKQLSGVVKSLLKSG